MSLTITQDLFVDYDSTVITVVECNDDALTVRHIQSILDAADGVLGVAATYGKQCQLSSVAFSTLSHVLVVRTPARHIPQPKCDAKGRHVAKTRRLIQDHFLVNPKFQKYAFRMDHFAAAMHLDLSIRISDAVDMLSVANDSRESVAALMNALGGETELRKPNVLSLFFPTPRSPTVDSTTNVALQAWAACRAATLLHMTPRFAQLPRINTLALSKAHLGAVANILRNAVRLDALKPVVVKNDVRDSFTVKEGTINLVCARFSTRIKKSKTQTVQVVLKGKEATSQVVGQPRVNGRSARINVNEPVRGNKILSVMTFGRDEPTCAESVRQDVILEALQHKSNIFLNPFFQTLWLPAQHPPPGTSSGATSGSGSGPSRPAKAQRRVIPVHFPRPLNTSQRAAVKRILSDEVDHQTVVIQGPPGTGKTTVIAASVISHHHATTNQAIWIAAQSNVAVKNIAEKFAKEDFDKYRLLVSKDFHYDWHEHLYEKVEPCFIRSDNFPETAIEASRLLLDCRVILCTLSMLSNPHISAFLRVVLAETIILDEASQIECGNYLPIFHLFDSTLSKLVFIGDDKQLPPYGQEDIQELRSVFEFPHLRKRALFLDTQYRMPHVIGNFISRKVYGGKLRTEHPSKSSKVCRFVDVGTGREAKKGHSWINNEEARVVVKLARLCISGGMSFRIITPYDAQRSHIEDSLRRESLSWEDKVFNVDSFQGNEDDHIIVSVVRSHGPGFLKNQRRTNVMLTRCKKSMVICSSRDFLLGSASKTLVGQLAACVGEESWVNGHDIICDRVRVFA